MRCVLGVAAIVLACAPWPGAANARRGGVALSDSEIQAVLRHGPWPMTWNGDPSNRVSRNASAVDLGKRLFFDTRLSSTSKVSCATCHLPEREFQDGTPLASGVGTTNRRTMPIIAAAYSPFLFWDGRKDSLWSQALGPLESPVEHGGTREQYGSVAVSEQLADDRRALCRCLARSVHRFGATLAQRSVVIDPCETEIGVRQTA